MIESLFGYNLHNSNEEMKSKSPSPSKHVLEPKRLQNLTILLKALNATTEQVCRALVQGKDPLYGTIRRCPVCVFKTVIVKFVEPEFERKIQLLKTKDECQI